MSGVQNAADKLIGIAALQTYQCVLDEMDEAEAKAIDALSRYKFQMFGYWAAIWVHLNKISGLKKPNPFKALVDRAREMKD